MTTITVTIEDQELRAYQRDEEENHSTRITSVQDLQDLVDRLADETGREITVMCSSSLDFPEEYTEDQELINLCHQIRG